LGGIVSLFGRPQQYADFLDQEISFQKKQALLVVMPSGYGVQGVPRAAALAVASLPKPKGRTGTDLARAAVVAVAALAALAPIAYIKAHGALYHYCQNRPDAADALARVAREFETGLMGQPGFEILAAAERAGVPAYREGFADRAYLPDGNLMPRTRPGAVLPPEQAAEQAIRFAREGRLDSTRLPGYSPGAAEVAKAIREALRSEGIATGHLLINAR